MTNYLNFMACNFTFTFLHLLYEHPSTSLRVTVRLSVVEVCLPTKLF
jgi:hypothetical protein